MGLKTQTYQNLGLGRQTQTHNPQPKTHTQTARSPLREEQVRLVGTFVAAVARGRSLCHQMLMGEGKTTVISPLLALLIGDTALVIQIVPPQLLTFALNVLRSCFAASRTIFLTSSADMLFK